MTLNQTQTVSEFLKNAAKLLPDFDEKSENLQSFFDALGLVQLITGAHEAVAVTLIKTKLKGTARTLIIDEAIISQIVSKLTATVKGDSTEPLSAKL